MAMRLAPPKRKGMIPLIMGITVGLFLGYHGLALINETNCRLNGGDWVTFKHHCDMARMNSDWKIYMHDGAEALRRIKPVKVDLQNP